jgi:U3 small nucleolar RNA-associated protein 14
MKFMRAAADREREQAQAEALAAAAQLDADAAALEAGGRSAGGKRKRPAGEWDNISVPDEEDDEAAADRQRHKEMGLPDEQDQDDGDNDDDNDALQRRKPNVPSTSKAHTSVASAAAAAGRRQFGGTAVQAPAKAAASKGAPKEGSSFRVGTQAAVDVTLSTLSGSREAVAKGAGGSGSAWLTQGGVTFAAPNNSTATAAGEAGASSEPVNPWLDNPFDSSAGGAAAQTGAGRVKASQRAKASADTDRGTSQFILDVAGSIANLGGAPFAPAAAAPIPSKKQQKQKNKAAMDTPTKVASASATEPLVSTGVAPSDKRRIGTVSNRPNAAAREPELVIEQPDPAAAAAAAALADQAELIRRAFAGYGTTEDDLAADRLADAEEAAAEAAGVTTGAAKRAAAAAEVASKPGWGSWTGAGAETSPAAEQHHQQSSRNKKKNHKRLNLGGAPGLSSSLARTVAVVGTNTSPATTTARKDAKLSRVVITEKRDKKLAKHQAAAVPYPFTSAETYERSLLHPLGDAWNTLGATAEMTKPDWVTRAGLIIQPISQYKVKRGEGPDAAVASSAAASLPQIHTKRNMPGQAKATVLANRQKSKQRKS